MKISFLASPKPEATQAYRELTRYYGQSDLSEADYVVAIGGDGTVLKALHTVLPMRGKPVYAMRTAGSVGFLANPLQITNLPVRLQAADQVKLHALRAEIEQNGSPPVTVYAINEIVLMRQRLQAAKLRVTAVGTNRLPDLIGDGLLVASALGSTGYNLSAGGSSVFRGSPLLTVTGLAVHRRSLWSNVVLSDRSVIDVEVLEPDHRPVRLQTNITDIKNVRRVRISSVFDTPLILLFDPTQVGLTDPKTSHQV
jgi:NAD+ kinase